MTRFRVAIHVTPRSGILDPQGKAITGALQSLGFTAVHDVHVGRYIIVEVSAASADEAKAEARAMCERLLASPVTEDFEIASVEAA
jgi:phosphoribosylformylglycinamidine synthase PurS subunit